MVLRAIVIWLVILVLAILNGAFRVGVLIPRSSEAAGHVVSTLMLCGLIAFVSWVTIAWLHPATWAHAAAVAMLWVVMTVLFEFGFGHFVAGKPWTDLLADYNILRGRVWILVLVTLATAPCLAARPRGLF